MLVAIDIDTILKMPTQKKVLLLVGSIVVVVGLLVYLVTLPEYNKYTNLKNQVDKLKSDLGEQKKIISVLPKFRKESRELEQKFTAALKELPEKKEIPLLLMNISQLAQESGLQITLFQPQKEALMDFYEEIPVKVNLCGGYHNLAAFFDKVANLSRIVNIKYLTIGDVTLEGDKVNLNASCMAVTFRFVEKGTGAEQVKKPKKKIKKAEEIV
jgi:type IV pilus assembly protein PilO